MPTYEYRCKNGHTFEVTQSMTDGPVTACTTCSASVQRVFHPVAVHFKGSGFYTTDYGRKKGAGAAGTGEDSSKGDSAKKSDSSGDSKKSESKDTAGSKGKSDSSD